MSDVGNDHIKIPIKPRSTGWGGKALLVCALALVMTIPALFVWALIADRSSRSDKVVREVSAMQGGAQQVLGPVLVAPYTIPAKPGAEAITDWYVISADTGTANVAVKTDTRKRGIFEVPVYSAVVDISATFSAPPAAPNLPAGAVVDWSRAQVVLGFSDLRGGKLDPVATVTTPAGESRLAFAPASGINLGKPGFAEGVASESGRYNSGGEGGRFGLVSAPAAPLLNGGALKTKLTFTGAQRVAVLPFAKATQVSISGDWPAPSFDGGFLPTTHVSKDGRFTANWSVPFMARGMADQGPSGAVSIGELGQKDLGVSFLRTNNPYQNVIRALKYAVMFVGLVFLTFFVFEALSGRRLHPAQYILIGLAQMVFYLLLLSLSEYIGFDLGFIIAAAATVGLIGLYAGAAFKAKRYSVQALVIFSAVYGLIYLLMRLEDFALLTGSLAAFVGLSVAMWLTRNIDWYGGKAESAPMPGTSAP
ncbi:cell envelope integrity protein CreD [Caulobacter mirabilis]|nr:cell envelope integrity protein CreD [Caulobacter mirabilis]